MTDFEQLLSVALKRAAQPGDPTGVADVIRSRVDAGDTGTPADGAVFGRGSGWPWLPWVGAGLVVAVVGGIAGASGVFGSSALAEPPTSGPSAVFGVLQSTSGLDCPDGSPVVALHAGDRVLAVARSDDSEYLGVRSPADRSDTVWIPVGDIALDPDQPPIDELGVDGCPVPLVEVAKPAPEPAREPEPAPGAQPEPAPQPQPQPGPVTPPAPDSPPTLGTPSASAALIYTGGSSIISVSAADDKGVDSVAVSWSGADSGSAQMVKAGATWVFEYHEAGNYGDVTFTVRAKDTADQLSQPKSVTIEVQFFG